MLPSQENAASLHRPARNGMRPSLPVGERGDRTGRPERRPLSARRGEPHAALRNHGYLSSQRGQPVCPTRLLVGASHIVCPCIAVSCCVPNSAERARVFEPGAEHCGKLSVVDKIEIEETSLEVTLRQRDANGFQLMVDRCPISSGSGVQRWTLLGPNTAGPEPIRSITPNIVRTTAVMCRGDPMSPSTGGHAVEGLIGTSRCPANGR
jgi:hypothetical protein